MAGDGVNDLTYGNSGSVRKDLEAKVGQPIEFVSFAGTYLDGAELQRFLLECADAQVVILDAWNHPDDKNYGSTGWQNAHTSMCDVAFSVHRKNPLAKIFAQLMEGTRRVEVHSVAEPFKDFTEAAIVQAIVRGQKKDGRPMVLVFDDKDVHQKAAYDQLADCNLVVAKTYDEAQDLISKVDFNVVLLDLLVPASAQSMGEKGEKYIGQEMPLGTTLAWWALARGVKKIGVLTDTGHHNHPGSAALDVLVGKPMVIGDTRIVFSNYGLIKADGTKNWKGLMVKLYES